VKNFSRIFGKKIDQFLRELRETGDRAEGRTKAEIRRAKKGSGNPEKGKQGARNGGKRLKTA